MNQRSRIRVIVAAIALSFAFGTTSAFADRSASKQSAATSATAKGKVKVKKITFGEGDDVEGGVVGPDGENIQVRDSIVYSSLIRVRTDFVPEIFKSAENL